MSRKVMLTPLLAHMIRLTYKIMNCFGIKQLTSWLLSNYRVEGVAKGKGMEVGGFGEGGGGWGGEGGGV